MSYTDALSYLNIEPNFLGTRFVKRIQTMLRAMKIACQQELLSAFPLTWLNPTNKIFRKNERKYQHYFISICNSTTTSFKFLSLPWLRPINKSLFHHVFSFTITTINFRQLITLFNLTTYIIINWVKSCYYLYLQLSFKTRMDHLRNSIFKIKRDKSGLSKFCGRQNFF